MYINIDYRALLSDYVFYVVKNILLYGNLKALWLKVVILYNQKFSLDKKPSYLAEILDGIIFSNAVKVAISSMQSLTQD